MESAVYFTLPIVRVRMERLCNMSKVQDYHFQRSYCSWLWGFISCDRRYVLGEMANKVERES